MTPMLPHETTISTAEDAGHFLRNPEELVVQPLLVGLLTRSPGHPSANAPGRAVPLRPGAMDFRRHPSRRGNLLVWADGRAEHINQSEAS